MRLLFSGAQYFKSEQGNAEKSLGGFMSSTSVPNKKLNAIFSGVSNYNLTNNSQNTLAFFVYNDTATAIANITLETINQNALGVDINYCEWEYSVALPAANGAIEQIGSSFEEPFNANWFDCTSRYEDCNIVLHTAGALGDDFSIFGLLGVLTGNTVLTLQADIIALVNTSDWLRAEPNGETGVYFRSKNVAPTSESTNFVTTGYATIMEDVSLSGGVDNRTILIDTLDPDKAIGLWVKRKVTDNFKTLPPNDDYYDLSTLEVEKKEVVELIFQHD